MSEIILQVDGVDPLALFGQKNKINGQEFLLVLEDRASISKLNDENFKVVRMPLDIVVENLSKTIQLASTAKLSEILSLVLTGENQDKSEPIINEIIDTLLSKPQEFI